MQTVTRIGNSAGVIIPKNLRSEFPVGTKVSVNKKNGDIMITPIKKMATNEGVDGKFMKMVDEFATRHKDVLRELAKR